MVVIVLVGSAVGLRGHVTRWMAEAAPGIFVGRLSMRMRDALWGVIVERIGEGQALLIEPETNEQGWRVRGAGSDRYQPVEIDGLVFFSPLRGATLNDNFTVNEDSHENITIDDSS
ncbi:type I-E CRISPR-associated endoribonuclease Cas2e [Jatrophihabitans lederbergiae]|uniref:Type I-E CRISPR-associated endoribonuclease Cas2e n=1 Tax=Jatrophihabitans lederbergiae TaxID=3075547 RepID=A0ABU2JGD4_9ACTN|nr:type I-E CRISPR-associated endoribonuclease Cas2e [Jatrophihabitans sp. DSM 44399]MDT0263788.1 type I-E CRISPR-associated endoribonuclease Cas2e [Jatrophihabitans sp. DSM 44399]